MTAAAGFAVLDAALGQDVFVSLVGELPPSSAGEIRTYFIEIHRCCVRALTAVTQEPQAATAFVHSERIDLDPVYDAHSDTFTQISRLDEESSPTELGPILLTSPNLRLVYARNVKERSAAALAAELKHLGLGARPTALFVPAEKTLTFYWNGVEGGPTLQASTTVLAGLDPSNVVSLADYFHQRWTRYPDGLAGGCWDHAGDRVLQRQAERAIRDHMFVFLAMVVYQSPYVLREHQLPNGRVDIFIYGLAGGADASSHKVVELKVLRSRSTGWLSPKAKPQKVTKPQRTYSDAGNKRYVESGLRQAARYGHMTSAAESFLFCFDARLTDSAIDVEALAKSLGVTYSRYFMESSTKDVSQAS